MRYRPDLSAGNLVPAALGGIAAALVTSGFGVAGSLIGAALAPVAYLFVKEITRGPTERVVERAGPRVREQPSRAISRQPMAARAGTRTAGAPHSVATVERGDDGEAADDATPGRGQARAGARAGRVRIHRRRRRRWPYLAATAALAFVIAVSVVTVPELITGSSLTGDRRTTFFGDAPARSDPTSAPDEETPSESEAAPAGGDGGAETEGSEGTGGAPAQGSPEEAPVGEPGPEAAPEAPQESAGPSDPIPAEPAPEALEPQQ